MASLPEAYPTMPRLHPLERPLGHHARTLQADLEPAIEGDGAALRRCRAATRRLRDLAPLLTAELGATAVGGTPARLLSLDAALGPVGEIHVALDLLGEWTGDDGAGADPVRCLCQHLVDVRAAARRQMMARLEPVRATELVRRLRAIGGALGGATSGAWTRTLSLRMTRRAQELRAVVAAAGELNAPERMQAVRMAAGRLRYAFEVAYDAGAIRRTPPAERLNQADATLGRWHDLEVLTDLIQEARLPQPLWAAHLAELHQRLEQERERLYTQFLGQRRQLRLTCGAALDTAARLWTRRPGRVAGSVPLKMTLPDARVRRAPRRQVLR